MLCARWQAAIHSPVEVDVSLVDVELGRDSLSLRLHESILLVLGVHHVDRRAVAHSESIRTFMAKVDLRFCLLLFVGMSLVDALPERGAHFGTSTFIMFLCCRQ